MQQHPSEIEVGVGRADDLLESGEALVVAAGASEA
jgi:hypothetical protein